MEPNGPILAPTIVLQTTNIVIGDYKMSLYGSMFSGVTGLSAHSRALDAILDNIANINTVGFKAKTNHFSTLVAAGNAGSTPGVSGVLYEPMPLYETQKFSQTTASPSSFALASGSNGFFFRNNLNDNWELNNSILPPAGHFAVDKANHLANASGYFLPGLKLDKDGKFVDEANNTIVPNSMAQDDLLPIGWSATPTTSRGTDAVHIKATFPAQMAVGDTFQISSKIFDDLSGAHVADFNFTKADQVKLAGTLPRLIDGASPTEGNDTFTVSIATPASSTIRDGAPVQFTALDLTFTFAGTDASGVTTWNVVPTSHDGVPTSETADAFSISFDSDNI